MKYDDLEKLNNLREKGAISEDEYQKEKEKILNNTSSFRINDLFGMDSTTYCMLIHFSQLLGFILPVAGFAAPAILWFLNRGQHPDVDTHGKIVINWILTSLILYGICILLMLVLIGYLLAGVLAVVCVVFTIIGAMNANKGIVWKYPMTIEFIKV